MISKKKQTESQLQTTISREDLDLAFAKLNDEHAKKYENTEKKRREDLEFQAAADSTDKQDF